MHYETAVKIVTALHNAGHEAYFAGGWVRDFVMNDNVISKKKYRVYVSVRTPDKPYPITKTKIVIGTESEARAVESVLLEELKSRTLKGYCRSLSMMAIRELTRK